MCKWLRVATFTALCILPSLSLSALTLDQGQRDGLVGERPDGYIGAISSNPSSEIRNLVIQINTKRTTEYSEISRKHGESRATVEALAGRKIRAKLKSNEYYMTRQGRWQRK